MRNERPSFMRSAIAAAISSSFICTAALCDEFEINTLTWDAKNSVFAEGSAKVELEQTKSEGSSFRQTIGQTPRLDEKNMPYFSLLNKGLKDSGVGIVVQTKNKELETGQIASHFIVSIQKDGTDAIKMSRDLETGKTIFSIQKKLHTGKGFHSELKSYLQKHHTEALTIDDTKVAAPSTAKVIFDRLAINKHALTSRDQDDFTVIEIPLKGVSNSPPFINTVSSASASPDKATMVDVDGAIAAMMTAYTQSYLTTSSDEKGSHDLLASILRKQPGFMVGAQDITALAPFEDVPVFLIHHTEGSDPRKIELIPQSAAATVLLERYKEETDSYQDITLSKSSAKDLKRKAYSSLLQQLIVMKARKQGLAALPGQEEIKKLASDQELLFLCGAKLDREASAETSITLTSQEQSRTARLMTSESLLTYLRSQFMNHPEVGGFVMGKDLEAAVKDHLPERTGSQLSEGDQDSLNYLNAFYRKTHRSSKQRVNDHLNAAKAEAAEGRVQHLTQQLDQSVSKVENLQKRLNQVASEKEALQKNFKQLTSNKKKIEEELQKNEDEMTAANADREQLKQDNDRLTQEQKQLASNEKDLQEQLEKTKDQLAAANNNLNKLNQEKNHLVQEQQQLASDKDDIQKQVQKDNDELSSLNKELEELRQIAKVQDNKSIKQSIETLQHDIEQKTRENTELQSKLDTISKLLGTTANNRDGSFHPDATRYVRGDAASLLHPDIAMHDDILSQNEFMAMQKLNLPKDMLPDEVVQRLKYMEPLMEHFDGKNSITLDQFANELPDLQKTYFQPPRQAGESGQIKLELETEFQNYIRKNFGNADPTPFVNVIGNFNPEDVLTFGEYVRDINKIVPPSTEQPLLQRLNTYHIMSLQAGVDHDTLSTMLEYYQHAPVEYRIMWNQLELARLQKWLDQTMFVPDVEELNDFPESRYLPDKKRLQTLKDIASYSPSLTADALASYIQAAGKVMHYLSPEQLVQLQVELKQAPAPQQADASDPDIEAQYRRIAHRLDIPEESWEALLTLARQPAGLWKHTYEVIEDNGGTKKVLPDHVTPEEMKLAKSPFDPVTVIEARKFKELSPNAYKVKLNAQKALQAETDQRMDELTQIATDDIVYSSEQLKRFPDNSDLKDGKWVEPLKAFYHKLKDRFDRRDIVKYARLLAHFSPDEYNSLIKTIPSVIDLVDPNKGILPGREMEFNESLMGAALEGKFREVLNYIKLARENSRENLENFKEEALTLGQHPQAKVLTIEHIAVAMQEADPQKIMDQRQVLRNNPKYYDFMATKSASKRTEKLDQGHKGLNAVNKLVETYTADSDYDAERLTSQKQLKETLESIQQEIRETKLPELSKTTGGETPLYNKQLQEKLDSLTTGSNLKETRELLESWDDVKIVKITDDIQEPLHRIRKIKLPGELFIHPGPDMLDLSPLQDQLKTANSHSGGDRLQEKNALAQILKLTEPKEFQTEFVKYTKSKRDLRPYAEVHSSMLELKELLKVEQWSEEQNTRAAEIIKPWATDRNSETAKPFNQYVATKKGGARHHLEAARASSKPSPNFREQIKKAMESQVIKEAITIGNIRQKLSEINDDLSNLDELHKTLLSLKSAAETDGASEIEGVEAVQGLLADINEKSTPDQVIEVVKSLQLSDEASPINKALETVDGIVETTANIRKFISEPALQVDEDVDQDYLQRHEETIKNFAGEYKELHETDVWKEHVNQPLDDLTDKNGYPLRDKLEEIKGPLEEAEQDINAYRLFSSNPEEAFRKNKEGQLNIQKLEEENRALQEKLANSPLPATSESYIDHYLQLKPGSSEALLLGDLLRLTQAGVPLESFSKLDFQSPQDVMRLAGLAKNKEIKPEALEMITVRLMESNELIKPMLDKLEKIKATEPVPHRETLETALTESSAAADQDLTSSSSVYRKAMMKSKEYYDFAMPYIIAEKNDPELHNKVLETLKFYAEGKRIEDPTVIAPDQKTLDELGLTRKKSEILLNHITRNWMFNDDLTHADIIEIALLDMVKAELRRYEKFGYKVQQKIAAMREYASDKAQRLDTKTASTRKWLMDNGYIAGEATYHTIENLLYLYFRNRINVYLDDIAYNDGKGLIAAINDVGEGLDEFLLAAGLVRGEHQQQIVSDILNYFGKEAYHIYDEYFRSTLGERADFMDNVLKPAALAVQAPVGFHEIGVMLKLGGADNVWSWNTAWHTFGYTAIGLIVDMSRGNHYNKMMIQAIDPAMTNLAGWMDSKVHLYSDQSSPEDKYYSELWSSTAKHWNGWNDYLGQSIGAKMTRAPAELAQSLITTKIYSSALIPALNPIAFTRTNPAIRAANKALLDAGAAAPLKPEVPYWQPGFKSVSAYYLAKGVNDWSRNDLAGTKYLLEGFAGFADYMNGVPATAKNSYSQGLEKNLHKLSLSHQDTRFAEGKDLEAWTPFTNAVKFVATAVARVGQATGLDQLGGFSQGTYDQFGKPDLADQVRRPNTVSSWISTLSEYGAWAMKSSGASDAVLWGIDKVRPPVMSVLSTAAGGASTVGSGIVSTALTAREVLRSAEERIYELMGYQLERKSEPGVVSEHDTSQTVDPGQSGGDKAFKEPIPDQHPVTDQDENDESKVADQTIAFEQGNVQEPSVTESEASDEQVPDQHPVTDQDENDESKVADQTIAFEQGNVQEPSVTESEASDEQVPDQHPVTDQDENDENKVADQTIAFEQGNVQEPSVTESEASDEQVPDQQPVTDQDENNESKVADQTIAFEQGNEQEPSVTESEASDEQVPDQHPVTDQDENDENKVADQASAPEQVQAIEPSATEDDVNKPETTSEEESEEEEPYFGEEEDPVDLYDEDDEEGLSDSPDANVNTMAAQQGD